VPEPASIRLDEAVDLAHAWLQQAADAHGIRVLFIKGPALHRQGLRSARVSGDVDVLVEPAGFRDFCTHLADVGWRQRDAMLLSEFTTLHSKTYLREGWPCDIDVHSYYPGFLGDPSVVFESLWARRMPLEFAHQPCLVPDRVAGVLILALHSLRGTVTQERHAAELTELLTVELTEVERMQLADLAAATGSTQTLQAVLPRLGVDLPASPDGTIPGLREWRERLEAGSVGAYQWFVAFRRSQGLAKLRILWRAIWPTDHDLLIARPEIPDAFWPKLRGRVARWGRGLRSLPRAVRAIWHNRG